MKLSTRNQFKGTVVSIKDGVVTSEVVVDIGGGNQVVAVISKESVDNLGLKVGSEVTSLIKSTSVMLMA